MSYEEPDTNSQSRLPVFTPDMCAEDMEKMMNNALEASSFLKAISHEDSKCKDTGVPEHMYEHNKVRDKVFWMPAKLAWGLKV